MLYPESQTTLKRARYRRIVKLAQAEDGSKFRDMEDGRVSLLSIQLTSFFL